MIAKFRIWLISLFAARKPQPEPQPDLSQILSLAREFRVQSYASPQFSFVLYPDALPVAQAPKLLSPTPEERLRELWKASG